MAEILILAEQRFTTVAVPNMGYGNDVPATIELALGETYKIRFDNEDYVCSPIDVSAMIPGALALGNGAGFGLPGNGEPFIVAVYSDSEEITVLSLLDTAPTEHTISIYHIAEEDKEYLIKESTLKGIANAIRSKSGTTGNIAVTDMAAKISEITGGGGSGADVVYVTFMNHDGTVELHKRAVVPGNTCLEPVGAGLMDTPTRESTVSQNFTFSGGWATTPNGGADANALKNVTEDRTVYANYIATVRTYTISYYDGDTLLKTESLAYGAMPRYAPEKYGYEFSGWMPAIAEVTGDTSYVAQWTEIIVTEASGTCGDTATWELSSNGVLTISGTGNMDSYNGYGEQPWRGYVSLINAVVIEGGITSIGMRSFCNCSYVANVTIHNGVTTIGARAFDSCTDLTAVTIPASVTKINSNAFTNTGLTSAIFEVTSRWNYSWAGNTYPVDASKLADASSAATYLKSTYSGYSWTRT